MPGAIGSYDVQLWERSRLQPCTGADRNRSTSPTHPGPLGYRWKESNVIEHELVKAPSGKFEIHLKCRDIVYVGDTEQAAYNAALTGVGELCRAGAINPKMPDAVGTGGLGRVTHLIDLCAEAVSWNAQNLANADNEGTRSLGRQRMAALATALAALARVDLD